MLMNVLAGLFGRSNAAQAAAKVVSNVTNLADYRAKATPPRRPTPPAASASPLGFRRVNDFWNRVATPAGRTKLAKSLAAEGWTELTTEELSLVLERGYARYLRLIGDKSDRVTLVFEADRIRCFPYGYRDGKGDCVELPFSLLRELDEDKAYHLPKSIGRVPSSWLPTRRQPAIAA